MRSCQSTAWLVLLLFCVPAQTGGIESGRAIPLKPERLTYSVRWLNLSVVEATFELFPAEQVGGISVRRFRVEARTKPLPSRLYRVENRYETLFDADSGYPLRYQTRCDEAKFQETSEVLYDQAKARALYRFGSDEWTQTLPGETHTLFSALHMLRTHDFSRMPRVSFYLDAKGRYWRCVAERASTRRAGSGVEWEVHVAFEPLELSARTRQADILTENIVQTESPLKLRLRRNGNPKALSFVTRMEYQAKGFHLAASLKETVP